MLKAINFLKMTVVVTLFLATHVLQAQLVEVGTYDLQFGNPQTSGNTFCSTIQIRSAVAGQSFAIGSFTTFFVFNTNGINNPVYTGINFNEANLCALDGVLSPYLVPAFGFDSNTGEANVTVIMQLPNNGCPEVTDSWLDVGEVCFDIIDFGETTALDFDIVLTEINKDDNTPTHNENLLIGLDVLPDPVGIEEATTIPIQVYPNPVSHQLHITLPSELHHSDWQLTVQTIDGKTVKTQSVKKQTPTLELSIAALAVGVYWLSFENEAGQRHVEKFVKVQ